MKSSRRGIFHRLYTRMLALCNFALTRLRCKVEEQTAEQGECNFKQTASERERLEAEDPLEELHRNYISPLPTIVKIKVYKGSVGWVEL